MTVDFVQLKKQSVYLQIIIPSVDGKMLKVITRILKSSKDSTELFNDQKKKKKNQKMGKNKLEWLTNTNKSKQINPLL